jgi:tRNA G18 (ribose-2'-O)-methylase SpoU
MNDTRNVVDEFKGLSEEQIKVILDERGVKTEIAIENTLRDFNMGSIVRSANAFGIRTVHVVGRRQWNKRGAMMTDKYLTVVYHQTFQSLRNYASQNEFTLVAVDNVPKAHLVEDADKSEKSILLFGQEGPGLSAEALDVCNSYVMVAQRGSTRSLNVGVAAGIVMYEWTLHLTK